jgi:hypothetical protein
MAVIIDLVTNRLVAFLQAHGEQLVKQVLESSLSPTSRLIYHSDPLVDDPSGINATLKRAEDAIATICRQNDFARLMILFRKVPHELTIKLLRLETPEGQVDTFNFAPVYTQALMFGTNCLLKFSVHSPSFEWCTDRYKFQPTEKELSDAVKLMLLSVIHSHQLFYLNSVHRRPLTSPVSLDQLLTIYNRRQKLRWNPQITDSLNDVLIYPTFAVALPSEKRMRHYYDRNGKQHSIVVRNFLPISCNGQEEIKRFGYLDTGEFSKQLGVSFQTWCQVWLGLNEVILQNVAVLWPDAWISAADPDQLGARMEYADDYCETALGSGAPESIWTTCHVLLQRKGMEGCPALEECRAVVESLTYQRFDSDFRFPEQPFVFYKVSRRVMFWDYFRHGGLLRCIARNLSRSGTSIRKRKGAFLEASVKATVEETIPGVSCLKVNTKIKKETGGWEIDIGFVLDGVLFLVEAKNRQKPVTYYFNSVDVSARVTQAEDAIEKQDKKLATYKGHVRAKWREAGGVVGAICVICSEEVEFIASFDRAYWLDLSLEIPRVCLLKELIEFLKKRDIKEIKKHPRFVTFA